MPRCQLDHLVIAAATLEAGGAYLEKTLGVTVPFGGRHPLMATHNCLMRLGEGCFLEIIAIDADAEPPGRPRWFGLDDPGVQARIAERPRLHAWVVRTDDIEAAVAASPVPPGPVEEGRRGDLVWRITIPRDGTIPEDGLFPTLIQWPDSLKPHGPAPNMPDLACRLQTLTIFHPEPDRLTAALSAIGAEGLAAVKQADETATPGLSARIATPRGAVELA